MERSWIFHGGHDVLSVADMCCGNWEMTADEELILYPFIEQMVVQNVGLAVLKLDVSPQILLSWEHQRSYSHYHGRPFPSWMHIIKHCSSAQDRFPVRRMCYLSSWTQEGQTVFWSLFQKHCQLLQFCSFDTRVEREKRQKENVASVIMPTLSTTLLLCC